MDDDFPEVLARKIAAFEGHASIHHTSRGARREQRGLAATFDEPDGEIARLDTVMRNTSASNRGILAAWNSAHHLERGAKRRHREGDGAAPTRPAQN